MTSKLESTPLGRTGIEVTRLCLGAWQASGWASSDERRFVETIRRGIELGVNFIDSAEAYGNGLSERLVGEAIEGMRDRVVLATKFLHTNSEPKKLRQALERSLRNLRTDYIDLYQQHWPPISPPLEETINELLKLREEGKIRAVGVSNWMEPEWDEVRSLERIDSLQGCYSLLWRGIEKNVLPLCRKHGIALLVYSPLCQGFLTGRFKRIEDLPDDTRRKNFFASPDRFAFALKVVAKLEEIANRLERSPTQIALRWLLDQPGVTSVIVGSSSPEQIEHNIGALGWKLNAAAREELNAISASPPFTVGPHDSLWGWHSRKR